MKENDIYISILFAWHVLTDYCMQFYEQYSCKTWACQFPSTNTKLAWADFNFLSFCNLVSFVLRMTNHIHKCIMYFVLEPSSARHNCFLHDALFDSNSPKFPAIARWIHYISVSGNLIICHMGFISLKVIMWKVTWSMSLLQNSFVPNMFPLSQDLWTSQLFWWCCNQKHFTSGLKTLSPLQVGLWGWVSPSWKCWFLRHKAHVFFLVITAYLNFLCSGSILKLLDFFIYEVIN